LADFQLHLDQNPLSGSGGLILCHRDPGVVAQSPAEGVGEGLVGAFSRGEEVANPLGVSVPGDLLEFLGEAPFGMPKVERLLHAKPQPRTVATELAGGPMCEADPSGGGLIDGRSVAGFRNRLAGGASSFEPSPLGLLNLA
jgi:hypothetical protein